MVNILIAPDKFKGSLTAREVCEIVKDALSHRSPHLKVSIVPLADGGEGTHDLLKGIYHTTTIIKKVSDPLFRPVEARYSISNDGRTAVIEMASASGLQLLAQREQNPLYTTTHGTGELIADALSHGVRKIVLGIGGSATNDAGIGMASALGYEFYDAHDNLLKPTGENLINIARIAFEKVNPHLKNLECITLCDVTNRLHGPQGAAYVYAPQKGASLQDVSLLDEGLRHFENVVRRIFGIAVNFPGAGAAGGMGAGVRVFLNSAMQKGIQYIMDLTKLEEKISAADLVITGEGKIDTQSLSGKVIKEVSQLAARFQKPVVAICGQCQLSSSDLKTMGIQQCIELVDEHTGTEEAMQNAHAILKKKVIEQLSL